MTEVANVYGGALYELCRDENLSDAIREELSTLQQCFREAPDYLKLLSSPSLPKAQRCDILNESFRGKLHPYVLNFLKILTEKGYIRQFSGCCDAYFDRYNQDHGILSVTAVSAVELNPSQKAKLVERLQKITGKNIHLLTRVDQAVLGGIRLDYDGQCLDDTLSHRMNTIRETLRKTIL